MHLGPPILELWTLSLGFYVVWDPTAWYPTGLGPPVLGLGPSHQDLTAWDTTSGILQVSGHQFWRGRRTGILQSGMLQVSGSRFWSWGPGYNLGEPPLSGIPKSGILQSGILQSWATDFEVRDPLTFLVARLIIEDSFNLQCSGENSHLYMPSSLCVKY
jgi:hypothetical protein